MLRLLLLVEDRAEKNTQCLIGRSKHREIMDIPTMDSIVERDDWNVRWHIIGHHVSTSLPIRLFPV